MILSFGTRWAGIALKDVSGLNFTKKWWQDLNPEADPELVLTHSGLYKKHPRNPKDLQGIHIYIYVFGVSQN